MTGLRSYPKSPTRASTSSAASPLPTSYRRRASTRGANPHPISSDLLILDGGTIVELRRSVRRRVTVSAHLEGDHVVVCVPAHLSRAEEQRWAQLMVERLARRRRRLLAGDEELLRRALQLSRRYLGGRADPRSVRWVSNQGSRWGSCTPQTRTIRLSDRLQAMPSWVRDYVLVHELAHLIDPTHGPGFQALVRRFPFTERAKGYLQGVADAWALGR
ncbi:MAG: M48 family metallopeptidase [Acidothermus sp.]|nr:M48 family metallopeptidase [Acidothermus sp.]